MAELTAIIDDESLQAMPFDEVVSMGTIEWDTDLANLTVFAETADGTRVATYLPRVLASDLVEAWKQGRRALAGLDE